MRTHLTAVVAFALALAACGSSESDSQPAGWSGTLSGTLLGEAFTPADVTGILMDPMPCDRLDGAPPGTHTIAEIQFSSAPGVCKLAVDTGCCGLRAAARQGHFALVRSNVLGGAVPPIGPRPGRRSRRPLPTVGGWPPSAALSSGRGEIPG